MTSNNMQVQDFDDMYGDLSAAMPQTRQSRRKRKPRANPKTRRAEKAQAVGAKTDAVEPRVDIDNDADGLDISYKPSRYEAVFLADSIRPFFNMAYLTDIQAMVKGGKEASVYRCEANPDTGHELLAAKIYRPRMFRNLRNDQRYSSGRQILRAGGHEAGKEADRIAHAIQKKTAFGREAAHTSWLMYEYTTLKTLFEAGASVPEPLAASTNGILMAYIGDEYHAAPTLHEVDLEPNEAQRLFNDTLLSIEIMLKHNVVHGDLSAYNILYWEGEIVLIDFPQVVNPHQNTDGYNILLRDITRICDYFERQGVDADPNAIMDALWSRYMTWTPDGLAAEALLFASEPDPVDDDDSWEDA